MWSFTIRLVMAETGEKESEAAMVFLWSILAFTAFRFVFTWLMKYFRPVKLLAIACLVGICCVTVIILGHGLPVIFAIVATSAAMSLMFPTIYGIALENVDHDSAKIAASGLIMAILGGALITPTQAWVSDRWDIAHSFVVPIICFAVIFIYSMGIIKHSKNVITK